MTAIIHAGGDFDNGPEQRSWLAAMWKGLRFRCPQCGERTLFRAFLKVSDECKSCGLELHHHRADDAPPYFTIFIVGKIVVPAALSLEMSMTPPLWVHMALWLPLTVILSLLVLPPVKGSLVGLQWALFMHGFGGHGPDEPWEREAMHARTANDRET